MSTFRTIIFGLERRIELTVTGVILVKEVSVIEFAMQWWKINGLIVALIFRYLVGGGGGGGEVKGKGKKGRLISPSPSPILNLPSAKP